MCNRSRVESGFDDPDNLGHFFGGSSWSHLQTKLSGCDPDITCSLETVLTSGKWANFGSDECTEISLVWNLHLYQAVLKHVVSKDFIFCARNWFSIQSTLKKSMACSILKIFHVMLHYFYNENFNAWVTSGSNVGHIRIVQWIKWVNRYDPLSTLNRRVAWKICQETCVLHASRLKFDPSDKWWLGKFE